MWKFTPSAIWSTIIVLRDLHVVHRPVEPDADLGVVDVQAVDRRVAQRAADAVDLVGVDALAHVALDGEPGQVHVVAAADGRVLAVEADAGVHGAVGCGRRQRHLRAADDRVPAAGALDRDVVDDDVAVHLEDARRHVDRQVRLLGERDRLVERVGRVLATERVGAEQQHVRGLELDRRQTHQLGVEQVDDGPGHAGRRGQADDGAGAVGRGRGARAARRRSASAGTAW